MKRIYLKCVLILFTCLLCYKNGYSQSYNLGNTESSYGWFRLGTLSLPQAGVDAELKIIADGGYNANFAQQGECTIHFRTSNGVSANNGFYASGSFYNTGRSKVVSALHIVQVDLSNWDFYAYLSGYTGTGALKRNK